VDGTLFEPGGLACALRSLRPHGVCTVVTLYLRDPHLPFLELYAKGARIETGRVNARGVLPDVLALASAGWLHPEIVTGAVLAWEDAPQALLGALRKSVFVRPTRDPRE
jgi:threonine dehydrogenase-like Zn-dependent dehydrogenase